MDIPIIKEAFRMFMDSHKDWAPYEYVHKEDQGLMLFMNTLIDTTPTLCHIVECGEEKDICNLLMILSENIELSPMVIVMEKCIVANFKRRENLQMPISKEIVQWFRKGGWKFPKLDIEMNIEMDIELTKS